MRIAKPILLVSTPIGVVWGLYEAYTIRWWLGLLMFGLVGVIERIRVGQERGQIRQGNGYQPHEIAGWLWASSAVPPTSR